jgi:dolichol kinase
VTAPPLALHRELSRKAIHLLSAAAPLAYAGGLHRTALIAALGAAAVIAIAVEVARRTSTAIQRRLDRAVGELFRAHEHASVTGATWLVLALLGAALLLPRPLAIATMWAVAVGDPAAALVGRTVGQMRFRPGGKSLEGALSCLAITFAGALLIAGLPVSWAAVAGLTAALAEWPNRPFDDNVRVAVAVGSALTLLRMFAA